MMGEPSMGFKFRFLLLFKTSSYSGNTMHGIVQVGFSNEKWANFPQTPLFPKLLPFDKSILYYKHYTQASYSTAQPNFFFSANTTIGMIQTYTVNEDIL